MVSNPQIFKSDNSSLTVLLDFWMGSIQFSGNRRLYTALKSCF